MNELTATLTIELNGHKKIYHLGCSEAKSHTVIEEFDRIIAPFLDFELRKEKAQKQQERVDWLKRAMRETQD